MIAISCDAVATHEAWITDIVASQAVDGDGLGFPIIGDSDRTIVESLGMIDGEMKGASGMPMPARAVIVVSPGKTVALSILYPATTGRNFDEILRVIDSLQLTAKYSVATPANWKDGSPCMLTPGVTTEQAAADFPDHEILVVPSEKPYLRITPQPGKQ